jgi:predicted RNA-binding protein with PUA-like domain
MSYWIGVIGTNQTYERFGNEDENWFCLPRTAQVGDSLVLYATKKIAKAKNGLFASYKIVQLDPTKNAVCNKYGTSQGTLVHVDMLKDKTFKNRVTLDILRNDDVFKTTQFVRRNAQATYFSISEEQFKQIIALSKIAPSEE